MAKKKPPAPRQGDAALRESEARYRTLTEHLTELVYRADPVTLAATFVNHAVETLYGYSPHEWVDNPNLWADSIHPEDRARVLETFVDAQRHGTSAIIEYRIARKDGALRWVIDRFGWEKSSSGDVVSLVGVMSDITERTQAEEARRESERKLAAIVETLPGFLYRCANTRDYPMEFISRGVFELTGYRPEEFLSGTVVAGQITHPEDAERAWNDTQAGLRSGGRYQLEYRLLHRNGQVTWAWERGVGVYDSQHNLLALEGVVLDVTERKHAEEALLESEERLRLFIEHAPAALAMFDRHMRYLAASRRWVTDYRLGHADVIGRVHYDVFPDIPERWRAVHARGMAGETLRADEDVFERADGTEHYLRWEVRPWHAADGAIGGIVIFTEDITERKRAEVAVRESEERLRLALDAALMGIFDWDVPHNRITWSRRHEELWGFAPGEFAGTYEAFAARVHRDDLPGVNEEVARCIAGEKPFVREFRVVWPDGGVHWIAARGEFAFDADGRPSRMRGAVVDVSARKRTEEALRESSERLARVIATDASGIVVVDASGMIALANPAIERMAGLPPGSMAGRHASEVAPVLLTLDGEPLAEDARPFHVAMRTGRPVHDVEVAVRRPDGRRILLSVNAAPLLNDEGTPSAVVATLTDITERKRAEAQTRESAAALRALSARLLTAREEEATRIARELHDDLGQALTGLKIDLSWVDKRLALAADTPDTAALREKTAAMARQIDEAVGLVRRLATDLRPGLLDDLGLAAAIEWQAQDFQARTGVACTSSIAADLAAVEPSRATALYRILQEALTNVVRHARATRVDVTLELEGASIVLDVRDDGCGITTDAAAAPRSLGMLGMRERAHAFNGEMTVSALAPHGTRVHVEIPM